MNTHALQVRAGRYPKAAPSRETLSYPMNVHQVDLEEGSFEGMASVFDTPIDDIFSSIILQGAFRKTLQENANRVRILWQHDLHQPIGLPTRLTETSEGLEITAKLSETRQAQEALILLRDGVVDELSIGFDPIDTEEVERDGQIMRLVKEIRLWEVSLVTFGANPRAKVRDVNESPLNRELGSYFILRWREDNYVALDLGRDRPDRAEPTDESDSIVIVEQSEDSNKASFCSRRPTLAQATKEAEEIADENPELQAVIVGQAQPWTVDGKRLFREVVGFQPEEDSNRKPKNLVQIQDWWERHVRSTARRPSFEGTENTPWSPVSKSLDAFIDSYFRFGTDEEKPEDFPATVADLPQNAKAYIASKTLLGESDADEVRDLISFPVVNPETNELNRNGLIAAKSAAAGARGAEVPQRTADSIISRVDSLLESEFDEEQEREVRFILSHQLEIGQRQLQDRLHRALSERFRPNEDSFIFIEDIFDDFVIFEINDIEGLRLFRIGYRLNDDEEVELVGEPVEVIRKVEFIEVESGEVDEALQPVHSLVSTVHAGRKISRKNMSKIKDAAKALQDIVELVEGEQEDNKKVLTRTRLNQAVAMTEDLCI